MDGMWIPQDIILFFLIYLFFFLKMTLISDHLPAWQHLSNNSHIRTKTLPQHNVTLKLTLQYKQYFLISCHGCKISNISHAFLTKEARNLGLKCCKINQESSHWLKQSYIWTSCITKYGFLCDCVLSHDPVKVCVSFAEGFLGIWRLRTEESLCVKALCDSLPGQPGIIKKYMWSLKR